MNNFQRILIDTHCIFRIVWNSISFPVENRLEENPESNQSINKAIQNVTRKIVYA